MSVTTLPSGTVTFLFTDIEGSSSLWERVPEAMRSALSDHDAMLREAVQRRRGIVFKTVGDAFYCVFTNPEDAIEAAIAAQRSLLGHLWPSGVGQLRVRMGIHSGQVTQRDGDYFGPTVNRVTRLTAAGSGGQILASSSTATLLSESTTSATALVDLGSHRLRDLSRPETIFQVAADGLPADFAPLASLDVNPNNLPSQFSSFVGRQREAGDVQSALLQQRLVTISGPGGIGKTRLALHVAGAAITEFPDGAWLVELSAISDPSLVPQAIARTLGVREVHGEPIVQTLLHYLSGRQRLLIFDNSEHLLTSVAAVCKAILSQCPRVTVLVTSREPLHLAGEQVYRLESMPDVPVLALLNEVVRHDSARLFLDRARGVAPALTLRDRDAADIAGICRQLQGIPLAIELAAGRVLTLSIHQLNERLGKKLSLLTSRDSTLERHRTLRATIEWSYRLLGGDEKEVFARLSVFAGGFTLEACEAIAGERQTPTVDVLESLVEKSLVQIASDAATRRFRVLDAVAEFAAGQLQSSEAFESANEAHARYYASLAARGRNAAGSDEIEWQQLLDDESHNVRVAFDWCLERDAGLGVRLALDLWPYWRVRGTITEARSRLTSLLAKSAIGAEDRAALCLQAAAFATLQDDFGVSLGLSRESLEFYRNTQNGQGIGEALFRIAEVEHRKGRLDDAKRLYEEARIPLAAAGDARGEMLCVANLGMLARQHADYATANSLLEDALQRATASAERRIAAELAIHLGWTDLYLNDLTRAQELFDRALQDSRTEGDRYGACAAGQGLGTIALKAGLLDEAHAQFAATIQTAYELHLQDYVFRGFHGIGAVLALRGDLTAAARYVGLAERLFRESHRELRDSIAYDIAMQSLRRLPEGQRTTLEAEGAPMTVEDAIAALKSPSNSS